MGAYLARHPHIEDLEYRSDVAPQSSPGLLPNVRTLTVSQLTLPLIADCSSSVLEEVRLVRLGTSGWGRRHFDIHHLTSLLHGKSSIRRLVYPDPLEDGEMRMLVDAVPMLQSFNGILFSGDVEVL